MDLPGGFSYEDINISVRLVPAPDSGYIYTDHKGSVAINRSAAQKITVNISYERDSQGRARHILLTGYKAPRLATVVRAAGKYPVSKELTDIPAMWGISSGGAQGVPNDIDSCCSSSADCGQEWDPGDPDGTCPEGIDPPCHPERRCRSYSSPSGGEGYYYVFRTGTTGPICCSWIYKDTGCLDHIRDIGGLNYAYVYLYQGIPAIFGLSLIHI